MKKSFLKKFTGLWIAGTLFLSLVGCAADDPSRVIPYDPTLSGGYQYAKESENLFQFYSSDAELDHFLNDYMERHLRYNENAINALPVGNGNTVWKEWESMSVMFMNTQALGYDPKAIIKNQLETIKQDKFGYIWVDNGTDSSAWGQGWQFPNSDNSRGKSKSYTFASSANGWTASADTGEAGTVSDGKFVVSGANMQKVTYTSPTGEKIAEPFHAPFVDIKLGLSDRDVVGDSSKVKDIYLSFMTDGDSDFTSAKKVSYTGFASSATEKLPQACRVVFPMYENAAWSKADSITGLKIEIEFNEKVNAETSVDAVRLDYDARQINNNGVFINAAAEYFKYAQDTEFLEKNMDRLRKAMQFYLTYCGGDGETGLVSTKNLPGHDGSTNRDFMTSGKTQGIGEGIGDGYWDCLSYPMVSTYCNNLYYKSLISMEYLERAASAADIGIGAETVVYTPDLKTPVPYEETSESLRAQADKVKKSYNDTFWNEATGRYHLGINKDGDAVDYGFTMFNQEAIQYGLAEGERAESIMSWINGTRTVNGDTSLTDDIYFYDFAPRWTTKKNDYQYWFQFDGVNRYPWSHQVQNGGTTLHEAYYDIAATTITNGADKSYEKLSRIKDWYSQVEAAGGKGTQFYLKYYQAKQKEAKAAGEDEKVWIMQGPARTTSSGALVSDGAIGLDSEFIEAAILYASVPTAYFGLGSSRVGTLDIAPNLPESLRYMKMENLTFGNLIYDLSITDKNFVQINSVRGVNTGEKVRVVLKKPATDRFEVRQHTRTLEKDKDYTVEGDNVIITAPLQNGRIQIIEL